MGQAKLRSKEIEKLKALGPKPKPSKVGSHVSAFGAYYHDDQPDGIGVFFSEDNEPSPGWTNLTFHTLATLVRQEVGETHENNRAERIAFAFENLKEATEKYNQLVFGSTVRDMDAKPQTTDLSTELIEIFVNVITNIWYLEKMGEIPNDDYNGAIVYTR